MAATTTKALWRRIASEATTPAKTGWAVGLGVLIGTTPFFGFHLAICMVVATALRLNRALTYLAAHVSVPWLAPFLTLGSLETGHFILHGRFMPLDLESLKALDPWSFGATWLVGSFVFGALLGVPLGLIAAGLMAVYRRRHPLPPDPIGEAMQRAALPYKRQSRFQFGYVRGKLDHDPVYRQLAQRTPIPSPVVDVGTGRGQTLLLLAELTPGLHAVGYDWDEAKLVLARRAAADFPGLRFEHGDIRSQALPEARTVLLLDVLHYSPLDVQDAMLDRAAAALLPGGTLYVRELDLERGFRARINAWQERLGCWLSFNRGATLCFRPAREIAARLTAAGLRVSIAESFAGTPLANVLITAERLH